MNRQEIQGRIEALQASLALHNVDAIWEDSYSLGRIGKSIRTQLVIEEDCIEYANEESEKIIKTIVATLFDHWSRGEI